MNHKRLIVTALAAGYLLASGGLRARGINKGGHNLVERVKVDAKEAESEALKVVRGGSVREMCLETDEGTLTCSFDITRDGEKGHTEGK